MARVDLFLLLALVTQTWALYSSGDAVVDLTPANFDKQVINGDGVWIVEFYAPWCGHCKNLVPEYKKAAKALKGVVKVGAVNADEHKSLGGQYGVQGFPTIKIFGANKKKPEDYNGNRNAQGFVDAGLAAAKKLVNAQLGGKSSGGGGGSKNANAGPGEGKDVVELTEANFKKKVFNSDKGWLVEFYAPWCGHCKSLAGPWADAASQLKGKMNLGALDATQHQSVAQEYGVQGYPTIKYFAPGSSEPEEYNGGRTASDIVAWAEEKAAENVSPPEIKQILSDADVEEGCGEHPLCVIAFLPHILDCQASCRNAFLEDLRKLGDKYKKKSWGWLWSEAVAQPDLEASVDVGGFGYPAMVVVSQKKMKYSILTGSFGFDGINEFLRDLSYGKGRTNPVRGAQMPKISKVDAWDGKDGELPAEEDLDLSDVDLDKDEL
ncbi:protein disulfide-isomerase A6 homolog [Eurytemora carolleeae]|uniref:protein disulfide-isomerase A6 homolog n=1 Tax=Eurytemora carolleeae TaxID=1294199 RepID=UPI000C7659C1|nr:protein disulfide-isomerase A6 homolog [Eurytemora carolleeae]|eukprot:XP_023336650.1 protein disulfide-isomerase A6 homolog [Eurytemora affinis]